mmetsp:Transcript_13746/g.25934  ORF Transcript_13746/g.25934 Transcript_13746/m.25934 type:complete len:319 (+) Transcript_13746:375-1331(+)
MGKPGYMQDGVWVEGVFNQRDSQGNFIRSQSTFRNRISRDGSSGFPAVSGRYHLIVALICPWAHRAVITRKLKMLEDAISIVQVDFGGAEGIVFGEGEGSEPDELYGYKFLHQFYSRSNPAFTGRVTVPVLWDKETHTIVNNESAEIADMLNEAFESDIDLSPAPLRDEMEALNAVIHDRVNNGVYKVGFAASQEAYETACNELFETLDMLEARLSTKRYLYGSSFTLGDVRLYTTLARFDIVYHNLFKCNKRMIKDYPNLFNYFKDLHQTACFGDTVDLGRVKHIYFEHMRNHNPSGIVPLGPVIDLSSPHGRAAIA